MHGRSRDPERRQSWAQRPPSRRMDALPMTEETGLDFASTISGRMHACGHDTHTAMLAGAARVLAARADTLPGEVRFMFQPGEEGFHGARFMLDEGLLDLCRTPPSLSTSCPTRRTERSAAAPAPCSRPPTCSTSRLRAAAATPRCRTTRAIPCRSRARSSWRFKRWSRGGQRRRGDDRHDHADAGVNRAQRRPGSRHAQGHHPDPDSGAPKGAWTAIEQLAENIAAAHDCDADVTITQGFPPTVNDARAVALAEAVATSLPHGEFMDLLSPVMGRRTSPPR